MGKHVYMLAGGGSGGHLTPLIAIAREIKKKDPQSYIVHIGQYGDPLNSIVEDTEGLFDAYERVSAGKFRRYHGESWLARLTDVKTLFFNVRDFFRFIFGFFQSFRLLRKYRPGILFTKGGYVCAPVGLAAGFLKVPYVTHDSDAMVSLAHTIIARKAAAHLTAMDPELYLPKYESKKTERVGVPVREEYFYISEEQKESAKKSLGYNEQDQLVLVVGGGLGARNINQAISREAEALLNNENVRIVHVSGQKLYQETQAMYGGVSKERLKRIELLPFSNNLHVIGAAADVVVTRAGATNMAELAAQGKACIVVPNPLLTGGHQVKNAHALIRENAIEVVDEDKLDGLSDAILKLLNNPKRRKELETNLHKTATLDAAELIASKLVEFVQPEEKIKV